MTTATTSMPLRLCNSEFVTEFVGGKLGQNAVTFQVQSFSILKFYEV